ncbi:hypothetical protein [Methylobacterium segetis]|uniref:hypothetical protein n=1 Tax=Methylobacterium segetis TaxID=2488750 RepID=UPI001050A721|nr:hypothetical protein [Methylobacterium segetis]
MSVEVGTVVSPGMSRKDLSPARPASRAIEAGPAARADPVASRGSALAIEAQSAAFGLDGLDRTGREAHPPICGVTLSGSYRQDAPLRARMFRSRDEVELQSWAAGTSEYAEYHWVACVQTKGSAGC